MFLRILIGQILIIILQLVIVRYGQFGIRTIMVWIIQKQLRSTI